MEKKLITEVSRIREMMGLSLLSEQVTSLTKKLLKAVGFTDSSVDDLAKKVDLSDVSKISSKSIDEWQTLATKSNINLETATDEQILKLIEDTPGLKASITQSFNDKVYSLAKQILDNTEVSKFMTPDVKSSIDSLMKTPIDNNTSSLISQLSDKQLKTLENVFVDIQNKGIEIPKPLQDLYDNITNKKLDADNFKNKPEPTETKGQADFENFKKDWIKNGVTFENQYAAVNVIKSESDEVFKNLPNQFDPSNIKVGKTNTYDFTGRDGELRTRTQIEVILPNGKKTIMYSSSGANEGTTGKKAGEWFWLPGFAEDGWYIKTSDSIAYTKGGNEYMTELAKFLETNGYNSLGKKSSTVDSSLKTVTPKNVSNNRLTSIIGDTSKIDWSKITNAQDIENYSKLIDSAIDSNDYSKISRGGFEAYGIPNFRTYIMDLDLKGGDVSSNILNGDSIYKTNRDIFDLYQEEGGPTDAFYDWLKTLPRDEMEDLYKYIEQKKQNNLRPKEGPSNWSDYQDPNRGNNPYYGTGSN